MDLGKKSELVNCDPNHQEARKDFWILHLDTLHPRALNKNRVLKY